MPDLDISTLLHPIISVLLSFGISELPAMLVGLSVALGFTMWKAKPRRQIRLRVLCRALLPRRLYKSRSGRTDIAFTFGGYVMAAALMGWALVSQSAVGDSVETLLAGAASEGSLSQLPSAVAALLVTSVLFLGFEFGYWLDHYLMHRVRFLWPFHAVHHSAESLSALTVYRVHPIDSLIYYNILAIIGGLLAGAMNHLLGRPIQILQYAGVNAVALPLFLLLTSLQHTHFWISFSGKLGRVFLSPAHHQIHHSADPMHFNKNLGNWLAGFDLLFGTLHVPQRKREKLDFGVTGLHDPHSLRGALLDPFVASLACFRPARSAKADTVPVPVPVP